MRPLRNVATAGSVTASAHVTRRGQVIGERYRLERPLERGAMGTVWRAQHVRLKAPVAIKFLDPSLIGDTEMHDRFMQEARSAAAVRCAHVVQVFDYGSEGGVPYIVMELLDGENLDARLAQRGVLTPAELDKIFTEIARGLSKAHAMGVVHRDLKPGNIFLAREGDHEVAKLVDFGIAKVKSDALKFTQVVGTQLGTLLGTPQYMSPEQVRGSTSVDYRTDIWALAIIACECLTGRYPFSGKSIGDLTVQICTEKPTAPSLLGPVPAGFDQWFFKAVSKKRSKRFESVDQMAKALSAVLATAPAHATATGWALPLPGRAAVRSACSAVLITLRRQVSAFSRVWAAFIERASDWRAFEVLRALPVSRKNVAYAALASCAGLVLLTAASMRAGDVQTPTAVALPPVADDAQRAATAVTAASAALMPEPSPEGERTSRPLDPPPIRPLPMPPDAIEPTAPAEGIAEPEPVVTATSEGVRPAAAPAAPPRSSAPRAEPRRDAKPQPALDTPDARLESARAKLATAGKPSEPPRSDVAARKASPRPGANVKPSTGGNPFADRL